MYFSHHSMKGPLSEYSVPAGDPGMRACRMQNTPASELLQQSPNPGRLSLQRPAAQATPKQGFLMMDVQFLNLAYSVGWHPPQATSGFVIFKFLWFFRRPKRRQPRERHLSHMRTWDAGSTAARAATASALLSSITQRSVRRAAAVASESTHINRLCNSKERSTAWALHAVLACAISREHAEAK